MKGIKGNDKSPIQGNKFNFTQINPRTTYIFLVCCKLPKHFAQSRRELKFLQHVASTFRTGVLRTTHAVHLASCNIFVIPVERKTLPVLLGISRSFGLMEG